MRIARAEIILKGLEEAKSRGMDSVVLVKEGTHPSRKERFELDGTVDELIEVFEAFADRSFT